MASKRKINLKKQRATLTVAAVAAAVYSFPSLADILVYNRQSVLEGEIWRIFTAPLVHFSFGHFLCDTLIFATAGFTVSHAGFPYFRAVCFLSAFVPGVVYLMFFPDLEYYGGLSGMATGAVVFYCLCTIFMTGKRKTVWVLIPALTVLKIVMEYKIDSPVFVDAGTAGFVVLPSAHIIGYAAALAVFIWSWYNKIYLKVKMIQFRLYMK